mgnify:CR=1 FL=1
MDNFAEQLVKKNETASDKTKRTALLIVGILLTVSLAGLAFLQILDSAMLFYLPVTCQQHAFENNMESDKNVYT